MNAASNSTVEPERATPTHQMPRSELEMLPMERLHAVYDAVCLAIEVLQGTICKPRYCKGHGGGGSLNAAGDVVDDLLEHLYDCRSLIVEVAEAGEPIEPDSATMRAWILLHSGAVDRDDLPDFSALAAELVARQSRVEFHAQRRPAA